MTKLPFLLAFTLVAAAASPALAQAPTASPAATLPATEPEHTPADTGCDHCNERMTAAQQAETEKTVLELEQKWCDAEAAHDVALLKKLEADTFVFTDSTGRVTTKKDEIAAAKEGGDKIEYKLSDMKAQVYGDTVVLTGQTSFTSADADAASSAYRWTDVFVRQANGEWQVVASQATALGQGGKVARLDRLQGGHFTLQ